MCFSCFCWHVEDHWSYSINYLHFGEIKTWYGVSAAHAEAFESAMKSEARELFERAPDLLHHLVTIMNPYFLRDSGVPIYTLDQHEGEFVVTFPRAYHAGFNQGFNFAEAVNFAPCDWIPMGRQAVESYKHVKRHTVFAHDELVCKIATSEGQKGVDVRMALAVMKEIKEILDSEKKFRKILMDRV
jgi:histone demethylase JARID1